MLGATHQAVIDALVADPNRRFPHHPRLVSDVRVFRMPDGLGVQFHAGDAPTMLRGAQVDAAVDFLLGRLDGASSLEQMFADCPEGIPPRALGKTLSLLHTKGLLADGVDAEPPTGADPTLRRQLLFWGRHVGRTRSAPHGVEIQRRLAGTRLALVGTGGFAALTVDLLARSGCEDLRVLAWDDDGELQDALEGMPVPPRETRAAARAELDGVTATLRAWTDDLDLVVTVTRNASDALLETVNRTCLRASVPWLRADEQATGFEIGPYVDPWSSACYTCLVMRRRSMQEYPIEDHLAQLDLAADRAPATTAPLGESVASAALGASLVVNEVIRTATTLASPTLLNGVLHVNPASGTFERSAVLRVPRCEACHRGAVPPPPVTEPTDTPAEDHG